VKYWLMSFWIDNMGESIGYFFKWIWENDPVIENSQGNERACMLE